MLGGFMIGFNPNFLFMLCKHVIVLFTVKNSCLWIGEDPKMLSHTKFNVRYNSKPKSAEPYCTCWHKKMKPKEVVLTPWIQPTIQPTNRSAVSECLCGEEDEGIVSAMSFLFISIHTYPHLYCFCLFVCVPYSPVTGDVISMWFLLLEIPVVFARGILATTSIAL